MSRYVYLLYLCICSSICFYLKTMYKLLFLIYSAVHPICKSIYSYLLTPVQTEGLDSHSLSPFLNEFAALLNDQVKNSMCQ